MGDKKLKKEATSEEQKAQEAEIKRQRTFVKDILVPYLTTNTKSVSEAKRLCYEVQTAITQEFQMMVSAEQTRLSECQTSVIALKDITKKGDDFKINQGLYDLFKFEKLSTTNALIGGIQQAIDSFVNEEMATRTLDTLKMELL